MLEVSYGLKEMQVFFKVLANFFGLLEAGG
jgi:hypothetical protein